MAYTETVALKAAQNSEVGLMARAYVPSKPLDLKMYMDSQDINVFMIGVGAHINEQNQFCLGEDKPLDLTYAIEYDNGQKLYLYPEDKIAYYDFNAGGVLQWYHGIIK